MDKKVTRNLAKFGVVCGIVMIICGIVITIVSIMEIEVNPFWRILSGIFFIALGTIYWITNSRTLKK